VAHPGGVTDVRFAATGEKLLSAGADGAVLIWTNIEGSAPQAEMIFHDDQPIACADASPVDGFVAVASASGSTRILQDHQLHATVTTEAPAAEALRFSPDGRRLAVWRRGRVSLRNAQTGDELWSDDAGLAEPRPTSLWDLPTESAESPLHVPTRPSHACWRPTLEFSPDGTLLVCTGWDAMVRIWDSAKGRPLGALRSHETAVYSAAFAPQALRLAVGTVNTIRVWDLSRSPEVRSWPLPSDAGRTCVAISRKAGLLAWSGTRDGVVNIVSLDAGGAVRTWQPPEAGAQGRVESVAFSQDGKWLAAANEARQITTWSVQEARALASWSGRCDGIGSIAFSPDGTELVTGGRDGMVRLWRRDDGTLMQEWKAHADQILCLAVSPDGRDVLTGGTDFMARLWKLGRAGPVAEWPHKEWVNAAAFSDDGRRVATGGADLTIRLGVTSGAELARTIAHAHWVNALAFLDEGRVLASGGNDGAVRFWECPDMTELSMVRSVGEAVQSLAASEDGRWLAIGAARAVQLIDLGAARKAIERGP